MAASCGMNSCMFWTWEKAYYTRNCNGNNLNSISRSIKHEKKTWTFTCINKTWIVNNYSVSTSLYITVGQYSGSSYMNTLCMPSLWMSGSSQGWKDKISHLGTGE